MLHATFHQNHNAPFVVFLIQKDVGPWSSLRESRRECRLLKTRSEPGHHQRQQEGEVDHAPCTKGVMDLPTEQTPPFLRNWHEFCSPKDTIPKERKGVSANMFHG